MSSILQNYCIRPHNNPIRVISPILQMKMIRLERVMFAQVTQPITRRGWALPTSKTQSPVWRWLRNQRGHCNKHMGPVLEEPTVQQKSHTQWIIKAETNQLHLNRVRIEWEVRRSMVSSALTGRSRVFLEAVCSSLHAFLHHLGQICRAGTHMPCAF